MICADLAAERALFHGQLPQAVEKLLSAYELAPSSPRPRWLLGIALGAAGHYATAAGLLAPHLATDPLAATLRASHLRQVERHSEAERLDAAALARTTASAPPAGTGGADEADAWADALIGLVADAVGQGHIEVAQARLDAATAALAGVAGIPSAVDSLPNALETPQTASEAPSVPPPLPLPGHPIGVPPAAEAGSAGWRSDVRLAWVAAEVALLGGDPATALARAEAAVRRSRAADAPRHLAKSLLFRGVAEEVAGRAEAAQTLARAAALAERMGLLPLVWPARLVRSRLLATADPLAAREEAERAAAIRSTLAGWLRDPRPYGEAFNFLHSNG
jgi:tetratricopeptide (TPR) repeat protein